MKISPREGRSVSSKAADAARSADVKRDVKTLATLPTESLAPPAKRIRIESTSNLEGGAVQLSDPDTSGDIVSDLDSWIGAADSGNSNVSDDVTAVVWVRGTTTAADVLGAAMLGAAMLGADVLGAVVLVTAMLGADVLGTAMLGTAVVVQDDE